MITVDLNKCQFDSFHSLFILHDIHAFSFVEMYEYLTSKSCFTRV